MLVEIAGAEILFGRRFAFLWLRVDLQDGPITPAGKQQVVDLRRFRLANRVAAVEYHAFLNRFRKRVRGDQCGNVVSGEILLAAERQ